MDPQPFLDKTENELEELSQIMNERGLIRQYSRSCIDRLYDIESLVKEKIKDMRENDVNTEALVKAEEVERKALRLIAAHQGRVPLSEIVRRKSHEVVMESEENKNEGSLSARSSNRDKDTLDESTPMTLADDSSHPLPNYEEVQPEQQLTRMLSISSELLKVSNEEYFETNKYGSSSMYCWGRSDFGALFHQDIEVHPPSESVDFLSKRRFMQISSNSYHSAAITTSGELYTVGANEEGQVMENEENKMIIRPRLMDSINQTILAVSCGAYHTVCVTATGVAISFGGNEAGQLGHSAAQMTYVPPKVVEGLAGRVVTAVSCGELVTILRTSAGEVFSCGIGASAGHADGNNVSRATKISGLASMLIDKIGSGSHHVFALAATGEMYAWGLNTAGQLGITEAADVMSDKSAPSSGEGDSVQTPTIVPLSHETGRVIGVTAGYSHSIIWTDTGIVLGCGSNKYGQLAVLPGLRVSSFTKLGLQTGYRCVSAACGLNHTILLCSKDACDSRHSSISSHDNQDIYINNLVLAFGANSYGQCGSADGSMLPLQRHPIEVESLSSRGILYIAAGGDQSFAIGAHGTENQLNAMLTRQFSVVSSKQPQPLSCKQVQDLLQSTSSNDVATVIHEQILPIFSAATLLAGSFIDYNSFPLYLNVENLEECYKSIIKLGGVNAVPRLLSGLQSIVDDMKCMRLDTSPDILRTMFIIWQCPLNALPGKSYDLMKAIATYVNLSSKDEMRKRLVESLQMYPSHIFMSRLLAPLQEYCSQAIRCNKSTSDITTFCNAIGWIYLINSDLSKVSYCKFYVSAISELSDQTLISDYVQWRQIQVQQQKQPHLRIQQFSFFNYPFLLSAEAKRRVLLGDAALQQQSAQQQAFVIGATTVGYFMPFFVLEITRTSMLSETLNILSMCSDMDLKKPMKVIFRGEEGIDEGGVKKEFFQLLTSQLFDIQYGMFTEMNDKRVMWFNKDCDWSSNEYRLVGILIGLAVYNGVLLDIHLPQVLYKKLLRHTVGLDDVMDIDPEMYKGLKLLLAYEPAEDVETVFCRTFEVTWADFDMVKTYPLMENGGNIAVTGENRQEYVAKYVNWLLVQSISAQFNDFHQGFSRVVSAQSTSLFRAEELELLVVGTPHLDFGALEANTEYVGDATWNKDNETIRNFWRVIRGLEFSEQQKFLMFTTGCMKAPVGGLGKLNLKIQRMSADSDMLPTAHTCFNVLLLPEYSSEEKLRDRLLKAIYECEGFGLK
mmetsp:Transcript_15702/g.15839  ORF Transcript_15702/g.15839 Transcript_15702/m.15839 type:complete len:1240 (+) Transcript_15702:142-3861(+)